MEFFLIKLILFLQIARCLWILSLTRSQLSCSSFASEAHLLSVFAQGERLQILPIR
jgi:hypothetical protein